MHEPMDIEEETVSPDGGNELDFKAAGDKTLGEARVQFTPLNSQSFLTGAEQHGSSSTRFHTG